MCQQGFTATDGQTEFVVTEMEITQYYLVSVEGILIKKGHHMNGNSVIFDIGLLEGTEVIIIN
jgi:hypothetical protein